MSDAPDREQRDLARFSLDASVVVEAGAGTGKTTLLTDRILFLLLGGEKPLKVEEVVALTFTEKAAGEIKARLSERLVELAAALGGAKASERAERTLKELDEKFKTPREELSARARAALEDLDKAPIGTIHAFCSQVLRLYPVEAGVDPAFRVDEGAAFDELFASAWAEWLDVELGERPPRREAWLEVLGRVELEELEALARELCSEALPEGAGTEADPDAAAALRRLAETAETMGEGRPKPRGGALDALAAAAVRLRAAAKAAEDDYPALDAEEPPAPKSAKWPAAWGEDEAAQLAYDRALAVAQAVSPRAEAVARRAARLLAPFAAGLRRELSRRGWVTFDGLLRRARDLARDHLKAREELKGRWKALLVDEFQDTDPAQGELLLYLSERPGRAATDWRRAEPAPGRLFVVGDPKQSIYRFRGADIAAYESFTARLRAQGALACALTANFRSVPGIVAAANGVFPAVMKPEPLAQPAYAPILPARKGEAGAKVARVAAVADPAGEADAEARRRAEAAWVAARILEQGALPGAPAGRRPLKDFAVLMRSSSALPAYLDAFKRAGIPYAVEIERDFYGAPEVLDLLNLLRVLDDPEDRVALAGLLRSPLVAAADDSLLSLARAGALDYRLDPTADALPAAERAAVLRLYGALRELRARAGRAPLSEFVAEALERTRLVELASRAYHGEQTASNLQKLARLAAEASETRGQTLKEFAAEVRAASEESRREGESPLADESLEAVRVLTMHKSKGLEFPVVFAVNLSATIRAGSKPAARADWSGGRPAVRAGDWPSCAAVLLDEREKRLERLESVRLLYVAMTRAKEELWLVGGDDPASSSLAAHLEAAGAWPAQGAARSLPAEFVPVDFPAPARAAAGPDAGGAADAASTARAWAARPKADLAPRARAATAYLAAPPAAAARGAGPAASSGDAARVGTLCHRVLERWDFRGGGDLPAACAAARAALERRDPGPGWDEAQDEARGVLTAFLASPAVRELAKAEILGREVPFAYADGATVVRGALDLVARVDGRLVVVDWKTGAVEGKTAAAARKKYAEQGRAYAEAVKKAWGEDAEFRVLFLRRPDL